jgi:hypothetical protein
MRLAKLAVLVLLAATAGCYRATIETGRVPSGQQIRNDWAHSFIAGLVPPSTVQTAQQCPNGIARVETQLSFLNMVANAVTFGLYSPMTITVQCAAAGENEEEALLVPADATLTTATRVFNEAVARSAEQGRATLVRFE